MPISVLRAAPYNLAVNDSVYAKVKANNVKGSSFDSLAGNGAHIIRVPDPPINLVEVYAQRTKSTLGITWQAPTYDGESPVIDYRVNIAVQGQPSTIVATGMTVLAYEFTGLTAGVIYEFTIEARNEYDYSAYSDPLVMLCAFIPEIPTTVATVIDSGIMKVSWDLPSENGSPITGYRIFLKEIGTDTFTEESVDCVGTEPSVISSKECTV